MFALGFKPNILEKQLGTPTDIDGLHSAAALNGVSICFCSHLHVSSWIQAFPCRKADAMRITKKLLENVFPVNSISKEISRDREKL